MTLVIHLTCLNVADGFQEVVMAAAVDDTIPAAPRGPRGDDCLSPFVGDHTSFCAPRKLMVLVSIMSPAPLPVPLPAPLAPRSSFPTSSRRGGG